MLSLKKRWRVILAAVTQDWHQEVCDDCKASWWADRRAVASEGLCQECEDRQFAEWAFKQAQYDAGQRISKGAA